MNHWFIRWFIYTYAVHLAAQTALAASLVWLFGYTNETDAFLATHRSVVAFTLAAHFVMYLLVELLSVDRIRLERLAKDQLSDD